MRGATWVSVCGLAFGALLSCSDCDRSACESLRRAASGSGSGIAGRVASVTDVVVDGCAACSSGEGTLALWRTDTAIITRGQAMELVEAREPDLSLAVDARYEQSLEPGTYLLCMRPNCIGVEVAMSQVTTVNIKQSFGPTSFFLMPPGGSALEEDPGFDVGY